jgi:hypothetical protein
MIVAVTFYSLYKAIKEVDLKEKHAIRYNESVEYVKIPAKIKEIGINYKYDYPDYIPSEIINEVDDNLASSLAASWGREKFILTKHRNLQNHQDGAFCVAEYILDGVTRKTTFLSVYPPQEGYKNALRSINQKDTFVYYNKSKDSAFIFKSSKEDIQNYYSKLANKEMIKGGIVSIIAITLGVFLQ